MDEVVPGVEIGIADGRGGYFGVYPEDAGLGGGLGLSFGHGCGCGDGDGW